MWHDDGVIALGKSWLHEGFIFKDIQSGTELGMLLEMVHKSDFVDHRSSSGIDDHRIFFHHIQTFGVDEVMRSGIQIAMQTDDLRHHRLRSAPQRRPQRYVCGFEDVFYRFQSSACHRGFSMRGQQLTVGLDVGLKFGVGIGIVVDEVHFVSLHHHPSIGRSDSPRADHAHGLTLNRHTISSQAPIRSASPCTWRRFPTKRFGNQPRYCPPLMNLSDSTTRRATANVKANANSAVVSVSTPSQHPTSPPVSHENSFLYQECCRLECPAL